MEWCCLLYTFPPIQFLFICLSVLCPTQCTWKIIMLTPAGKWSPPTGSYSPVAGNYALQNKKILWFVLSELSGKEKKKWEGRTHLEEELICSLELEKVPKKGQEWLQKGPVKQEYGEQKSTCGNYSRWKIFS